MSLVQGKLLSVHMLLTVADDDEDQVDRLITMKYVNLSFDDLDKLITNTETPIWQSCNRNSVTEANAQKIADFLDGAAAIIRPIEKRTRATTISKIGGN